VDVRGTSVAQASPRSPPSEASTRRGRQLARRWLWLDPAFGAPGDSGSPVLTADGLAAGDFTHLIVDTSDYLGSDHAGTRITKILQVAGTRLVNADGSTTGPASTSCG
jgi:hypothetical protein